jgi:hypothetical protein
VCVSGGDGENREESFPTSTHKLGKGTDKKRLGKGRHRDRRYLQQEYLYTCGVVEIRRRGAIQRKGEGTIP